MGITFLDKFTITCITAYILPIVILSLFFNILSIIDNSIYFTSIFRRLNTAIATGRINDSSGTVKFGIQPNPPLDNCKKTICASENIFIKKFIFKYLDVF